MYIGANLEMRIRPVDNGYIVSTLGTLPDREFFVSNLDGVCGAVRDAWGSRENYIHNLPEE